MKDSNSDTLTAHARASIGFFGVLRNSDFSWYLLGEFAYYTGIHMMKLTWVWLVYDMTKSPFLLGLAGTFNGLPRIVASLLGGSIADRVEKRSLLLILQIGLGAYALIIAALISTGFIEFWHLAIILMLQGATVSFGLPARLSFISELVSKEEFTKAYSLYYVILNLMGTIVPVTAGILVSQIGMARVFVIIGICQLIFDVALLMIRVRGRITRGQEKSIKEELVELFNFTRRSSILLTLMGIGVARVFLIMPLQILLPVFAVEILDVGSVGLGMLYSVMGIGGLFGSIIMTSISDFKRKTLLLLSVTALNGMILFFFSNSRTFYLSLSLMFLSGIANGLYLTTSSLLFQLNATEGTRGRATSLYQLSMGLQPVSSLITGSIAQNWGVPFIVGVSGLLCVAFCGALIILRPNFRRLKL